MTSALPTTAEKANNPNLSEATKIESKAFPLTQRLVDYNETLIPKQTEEMIRKRINEPDKTIKYILDYVGMPQEQMARGYVGQAHIEEAANRFEKLGLPSSTEEIISAITSKYPNMRQLNAYGGEAAKNMYKNVLGFGIPIGLAAAATKQDNNN